MEQARRKAAGFLILLAAHSALMPFAGTARAADARDRVVLSEEVAAAASGSEFVSGRGPGVLLMTVNLWGSVAKPGMHHVPLNTDLATLITYAGGPSPDADLGDITIRRAGGEKTPGGVIKVDLIDVLGDAKAQAPTLAGSDTILIPRKEPTISTNTVNTVGFVSTLLGLVLSAVAVSVVVGK